ncbi:MAG: MFS transporter [Acetobacteraceae bacterium]|nr:MFS transporter [Acetobacteraceae bacterium]
MSRRAWTPERAIDLLAILLSDVRYGLGAYLGVYLLTEHGWDPASIGYSLSFGGVAGLLAQTPVGWVVDRTRAKRALLAGAVLIVTATCLAIPLAPRFWPVAALAVIGSLAGVSLSPALAAISLGIVGPDRFARRAGRNESLFHLGNALINVGILLTAPIFGSPVLFWAMAGTGLGSALAAMAVPGRAIDHRIACGLLPGLAPRPSLRESVRALATSRALLVFAASGALFNLANASILGILAQRLAIGNPGQGVALTALSAIVAQSVMVPAAATAALRADRWGRKPLLMLAFAALVVRATLYGVLRDPAWMIPVQLLDGFAVGLLGALFPVVVADLTRGLGVFNAAQGAVGTLQDIGGVASGALAGAIIVAAGYETAFLTLAAIALAGSVLLWLGMPETRPVGLIQPSVLPPSGLGAPAGSSAPAGTPPT